MRKVTFLNGNPLWVTVTSKRAEWTVGKMIRLARAKNNGAPYYLVKTQQTACNLERLFRLREVAVLLEETVGGIVGGSSFCEPGTLLIQLDCKSQDAELLEVCLEELGLEVVEELSDNPIAN